MTNDTLTTEQKADLKDLAAQYKNLGVPKTLAVSRAGMELGFDAKAIAQHLGVEPDTVYGYRSKFGTELDDAVEFVLTQLGGKKRIHAIDRNWDLYNSANIMVLATTFRDADDYSTELDPENDTVLTIHLTAGGPSGEPTGEIDVATSRHDSLDALADDVYRPENTVAENREKWLVMFKEALGDDHEWLKTLPGAWDDTSPGHPDHPDHHQHQMRSVERSFGGGGRPQRGPR